MTWVVILDAWSVVGPFRTEQDAKEFAEKNLGEPVLMITPEIFELGVDDNG